MDTNYGMEIVRATEIAALTAAREQGLGDYREILNHARAAIAKTLNRLRIDGFVVNDRFQNRDDLFPMPATLGQGGPTMDLMAIALEAHHSAANGGNNATSYAVIAPRGVIQSVPNLNMYKIVVGPQVGNVIDINQPPIINVKRVARALRKYTENVTVCILNQARHKQLIKEIRECGARIKLIEEGELSGCLSAITGEKTDLYLGYGYAPEGALVAAAISCLGGYFEGKIFYENDRDREQAEEHGISDFEKIFRPQDLVRSKEVAIAATGVTDGEFLEGVRFTSNGAVTSSFIARAETKTYRKLETRHFFDYKPVF
ncbi:fructose-bisphosphatase class II family protein [Desulfofustis glycolicus]|jgi:fructose-1,6-bisphosphatase II|uniref:Fructose-1,6-bisphosphatase n=1 Tax=Desulfofustis glycolicus DSM 9705 TaxID=1121409 RepID=A0A1M5W5F7_9BACT|nr:fructose-bisphosphatase class II family protein [Desulfofustis glycolicus]MCB2217257.1 fructose-bisphosphatase class II family protein [Desulfobulbaceae bacterium]SHH82700.1 fructose-1,6-bisphosphatase II [Desulfofustis glycolicus DSM 9705]